ncbi:MAG: hypothetical protein B6D61_08365 [Bacteroidetes bacterium 4484_249]|nr:MAG: hypothetical protein B6D61_08365 [Bacteroidetes bacterium 4484_249]
MHYKGYGKHTLEELEQIIDELQNDKIELEFEHKKTSSMNNELSQLVRDIYFAAKNFDEGSKLTAINLANNISKNIEMFSRQYGFRL